MKPSPAVASYNLYLVQIEKCRPFLTHSSSISQRELLLLQSVITLTSGFLVELKAKGVDFVASVCGLRTGHMAGGFLQSITPVSGGFNYSSRRWPSRRGRLVERRATDQQHGQPPQC